jgi:hypothetical protein
VKLGNGMRKFYLHFQPFDFTLVVNLTGKEIVSDIKKLFAQRFNNKNAGKNLVLAN